MEWIDLAQDKAKCWDLVNVVKSFVFHKIRGILHKRKDKLLKKDCFV